MLNLFLLAAALWGCMPLSLNFDEFLSSTPQTLGLQLSVGSASSRPHIIPGRTTNSSTSTCIATQLWIALKSKKLWSFGTMRRLPSMPDFGNWKNGRGLCISLRLLKTPWISDILCRQRVRPNSSFRWMTTSLQHVVNSGKVSKHGRNTRLGMLVLWWAIVKDLSISSVKILHL